MASKQSDSLYPKIIDDSNPPFTSSSSSLYPSLHNPNPNPDPNPSPSPSPNLYPSLDMKELVNNLFPDSEDSDPTSSPLPPPVEETLILIPGAILHLIDPNSSLELASGDFSVVHIRQADNIVAVLARIGDVQWPIARDAAAVRLDDSHYFFTLHDPSLDQDSSPSSDDKSSNLINYGLTFASKGQGKLLEELDRILAGCSRFSRQKVEEKVPLLDGKVEKEVTPEEAKGGKKKVLEERAAAYWTTLAPNVEDYGGSVARGIAKGSGKVIQAILWCGDVTVDRLKWGEEFFRKRMDPNAKPSEVSKDALKRMKRFAFSFNFAF